MTCGHCFAQSNSNSQVFQTVCDSIYKTKGYKIIQTYLPDSINTINDKNCVFQLLRTTKSRQVILFQDTIHSQTSEIVFNDFNNDGIKDILINNNSDVRSNLTYYLYLVDTVNNILKKIKGFEEIKNPNYLPKYDLIDCYVVSGQDWTSFYKTKGDSIVDYDIVIYDDRTENSTYISEYKKAIQKILKNEKTSR